jgi:hypothetical protein
VKRWIDAPQLRVVAPDIQVLFIQVLFIELALG